MDRVEVGWWLGWGLLRFSFERVCEILKEKCSREYRVYGGRSYGGLLVKAGIFGFYVDT